MNDKNALRKEATNIGRTKKMLEAGYSLDEIRKVLGVSEVTIQSYKNVIEQAEANRANIG